MTYAITQLFDLTGKTAIVTGGATGIGQAIVYRLAEAGASVMIADINIKAGNKTANEVNSRGGRARAILANVSSAKDTEKVVKETVKTFGSLDILVNNAGIFPSSPTLQITEKMWNKVHNVNLKGTFLYSRAVAQEMMKAKCGGKIINIASEAAIRPTGVEAHYESSKAGVVMLTRSFALEFSPHKILVNAIAPGRIRTPGLARVCKRSINLPPGGVEEMWKGMAAQMPLRRMGDPDDIAKVVLFLASNAADYITGALIPVDGGVLLL